jgi:hypothetical protein
MGTKADDYCAPASLITRMAAALSVKQSYVADPVATCGDLEVPAPIPIHANGTTETAKLFSFQFSGRDPVQVVEFTFLLWSGLTAPIRETLDEVGHPPWALLTSFSKGFLKDDIADVVLYGGQYRNVMRQAVEKALCLFVKGMPNDSDPRICVGGSRADSGHVA